MAKAQTLTEYIYKIVPGTDKVPITDAGQLPNDYLLPTSDLDQKSGFVHMSTAAQIPNTLKLFFPTSSSSQDSVFLLRVPYQRLAEERPKGLLPVVVRWESPDAKTTGGPRYGEGMFPHIYSNDNSNDNIKHNHNPSIFRLTPDEVDSVKEVVSQSGDDGWNVALSELKQIGWLV